MLLACWVGPAKAGKLTVLTEYNPPFNYMKDGKVVGLSVDILLEIAEEADLDVTREDIQVWPWARGYQEVSHSPNVILFSAARTAHRDPLFQWVGPVMEMDCSFFARKSSGVRIHSIPEDLERYTIGTVRQSAPEQEILSSGADPAKLQRVHDLSINVKKLVEGRIDALLFNSPAIKYSIREMGLNSDDYEVVKTILSSHLYFMVSKNTDQKVVARLQTALDKLKTNGRVDAIIKQYL